MSGANYGGRQANQSAYIKTFVEGAPEQLWIVDNVASTQVLAPVFPYIDIYVPNNIYLGGNIVHVPTSTQVNVTQLMSRIQELEDKVRSLESRVP